MAHQTASSRLHARPKPTKFKVATDENAVGLANARSKSSNVPSSRLNIDKGKIAITSGARNAAPASRPALGEIKNVRKKVPLGKEKASLASKAAAALAAKESVPQTGLKRRRSPSLNAATARPERIPNHPTASIITSTSTTATVTTKTTVSATTTTAISKSGTSLASSTVAAATTDSDAATAPRRLGRMLQAINARRQSQAIIPSSTASVHTASKIPFPSEVPSSVSVLPSSRPASPAPTSELPADEGDETDVANPVTETEAEEESKPAKETPRPVEVAAEEEEVAEEQTPRRRPESLFELMTDGDWLYAPLEKRLEYQREIERVASTFQDEAELDDPTMVAEYADEIFEYMSKLEEEAMPMPNYMAGQQEITWEMRSTLIDWLLQVHLRYHMLPETLWIAINIIDRFLSKRVVSVVKLQLVGVTAMFVAAKYEEILAPSVDEYVKMTEGGYKKEEILKGEKIVLQTIDFKISSYCSPYSWVRRISKADDYNLQTRTLCKFLMEMTLLDHRFLRAKPSMIAAIGMYSARKMLGLDWDDAFIFYSGKVEEELVAGHQFIVEALAQPEFTKQYIYKKYTSKRFLKASIYACEWAAAHWQAGQEEAKR